MTIGIMIDIETLDTRPKGVVTQIGMVIVDLQDPTTPIRVIEETLPIQPQLELNRTIGADTMLFWMRQPDETRKHLQDCGGNDLEELLAITRNINRKLDSEIRSANNDYEVWARGPQFDVVMLESLFQDCGQSVLWTYDSVRDLRTFMKQAGVKSEDVDSAGLVPHDAVDDCKFQWRCYSQAVTHISIK